jgi:hypothetical protein
MVVMWPQPVAPHESAWSRHRWMWRAAAATLGMVSLSGAGWFWSDTIAPQQDVYLPGLAGLGLFLLLAEPALRLLRTRCFYLRLLAFSWWAWCGTKIVLLDAVAANQLGIAVMHHDALFMLGLQLSVTLPDVLLFYTALQMQTLKSMPRRAVALLVIMSWLLVTMSSAVWLTSNLHP